MSADASKQDVNKAGVADYRQSSSETCNFPALSHSVQRTTPNHGAQRNVLASHEVDVAASLDSLPNPNEPFTISRSSDSSGNVALSPAKRKKRKPGKSLKKRKAAKRIRELEEARAQAKNGNAPAMGQERRREPGDSVLGSSAAKQDAVTCAKQQHELQKGQASTGGQQPSRHTIENSIAKPAIDERPPLSSSTLIAPAECDENLLLKEDPASRYTHVAEELQNDQLLIVEITLHEPTLDSDACQRMARKKSCC